MLKKLLEFNSSRHRLHEENAMFAKNMPEKSLVLDAGCGDAPYKHLFDSMRYESADFTQSNREYAEQITYVCDLKSIPVKSGRFDFIICNQVLEHIPEPQAVINELHRVLKPGGKMLLTAPLFYQEHEQPYDYFRYTQFGWRYLLEKPGFVVKRLDWMEGFFGLCGYFFEVMYYSLPKKPEDIGGKTGTIAAPFLFLLRPLLAILAILFHRLEKHAKVRVGTGPKNYVIIVSKTKK